MDFSATLVNVTWVFTPPKSTVIRKLLQHLISVIVIFTPMNVGVELACVT